MHDKNNSPLTLLELIDDIQRLGLEHIFEDDIHHALVFVKESISNAAEIQNNLHTTALRFRLFRQEGLTVSQDVFKVFKDCQGNFLEHLSQDVKGMLSLYEASYLGIDGEDLLDEAKVFARKHLKCIKGNIDPNLQEMVKHSLDLPLNYQINRLEARWYIDAYSRTQNPNYNLLELAKLEYNMVQSAHQKDAIEMSRWWENLDLLKTLPFARNRLVECFIWSVGAAYEPQHNYCREVITKLACLITIIDDVYDVYSTLDEAKLFTDAVERWDANAVEDLPDYMKLCFLALFNTVNEFAYDTIKESGLNIIPCLKQMWVRHCKAYLLEATWFHSEYKPTLEEYLDNGSVSVGFPLILVNVYFAMHPKITEEALLFLKSYPDLIRLSSMVVRLTDDLGTSTAELERGDNIKSIQCYMNDKGVTEEIAREYIRDLTDETWKKINAVMWAESPVSREFIKVCVHKARAAEAMYQYEEDGHGDPSNVSKSRVLSLLVDAIPV
ncbi:Myrcene synthase protein [Thalictrum thalictroides]|uniref:Myrcene synthase protein n=1 Tax=Thalictrum thalictroides TaxID=46969 RepID=A0A7J6VVB5_THATH|nr:Myrcene synthase protein [Thalictrum thalictroides]